MHFHARRLGVFAILLLTSPVFGQRSEALKHARAGFDYEQQQQYQVALYEYNAAIHADSTYPYPVERIAGMYQVLKNYPLAISFYERSIKLDSAFDVYNYYNLGLSFRIVEKLDSAVLGLREFIRRMDPVNHADTAAMADADWWIKFDLQSLVVRARPRNTEEPMPLTEINSKYDDFGPSVTADGHTLYFTSRRPGTNTKPEIETGDYGDDLFVSHDSLGHWLKPEPLPPPLNSIDDEGAASVTADGQTMFLSLCRRPDGVGDCDLYESQLVGDQWTKPQNLGRPLNSPEWDAQPSVTADGTTMYFSSRRAGSMEGSEDIYVSYRGTDGSWSPPHNLGEPVNTRFNERSPFISADGKTLYFSSNGHPGFGNHDLFMTRKLDDGSWSVPINIGRPINAYGDDAFLTIPASGDKIIYSSQRSDAHAPLNLYEAKLPAEFRPGPVTLVAGTVYDRVTHLPVAARVDVNDLKTDQLVAVYRSNKVTGKFYITLGTGKMYGVTATAPGYAPFSDHYTVPDTISYREVTHDLPLTPLPNFASKHTLDSLNHIRDSLLALRNGKNNSNDRHIRDSLLALRHGKNHPNDHHVRDSLLALRHGKNNPNDHHVRDSLLALKNGKNNTNALLQGGIDTNGIELHNVFFDFDKSTLRIESHSELMYWVDLLKKSPTLQIEIDGHTDSVGTAQYNLRLSLERAQAVRTYLVAQGIAAKRLVAKGFGATKPLASNNTDEGRQRNRRTEFRFLKETSCNHDFERILRLRSGGLLLSANQIISQNHGSDP